LWSKALKKGQAKSHSDLSNLRHRRQKKGEAHLRGQGQKAERKIFDQYAEKKKQTWQPRKKKLKETSIAAKDKKGVRKKG